MPNGFFMTAEQPCGLFTFMMAIWPTSFLTVFAFQSGCKGVIKVPNVVKWHVYCLSVPFSLYHVHTVQANIQRTFQQKVWNNPRMKLSIFEYIAKQQEQETKEQKRCCLVNCLLLVVHLYQEDWIILTTHKLSLHARKASKQVLCKACKQVFSILWLVLALQPMRGLDRSLCSLSSCYFHAVSHRKCRQNLENV